MGLFFSSIYLTPSRIIEADLLWFTGKGLERERRAGKDAGGEPEEDRRSPEKGSSRAAAARGGTVPGARRAAKTKGRGYAKKETARGGRTAKPD